MIKTRTVHLPLPKLEKCELCSSKMSLRLCSACGECTYCSPKCQKEDWPKHKISCGKTDRIDLERFYPILATFAELLHNHPDKPHHPAIAHRIVNAPNPGTRSVSFPDGSGANLLILGDPIVDMADWGGPKWWPLAASAEVRGKLFRRILHEGYVLPVVMSLCLCLLSEIYTTTYVSAENSPDKQQKKRIRLTYKSSPIADFGIASGSAIVQNQDKLAYRTGADETTFFHGQDSNDHHWIYFTTIRGEDVVLDCSMYTFNMCLMLDATPYLSPGQPLMKWIPAFLRERHMDRYVGDVAVEKTRASVLRNADLQRAIAHSSTGFQLKDVELICKFMEKLGGRPLSRAEMDLTFACTNNNAAVLSENLETRAWANFPSMPVTGIDRDPDEVIDSEEDDDETWLKHMRKVRKKKDINPAAARAELAKWDARREKNRKEKK